MNAIGTDSSTTITNATTISAFVNNLKASPHITGNNISLIFGEQLRDAQSYELPLVVLYLDRASFSDNLFDTNYINSDAFTPYIWGVKQRAHFEIWASSSLPNATFEDEADACWRAMSLVLNALYDQRIGGLKYRAVDYVFAANSQFQFTRFGQSLVLNIELTIPITYTPPVYIEVDGIDLTTDIEGEET